MALHLHIHLLLILIINVTSFKCVCGLWPPEYAIDLDVTESFVISDMFDSDDANDFSDYDMEMIKKPSLKILNAKDDKKYFMLHNIANRIHREAENAIKTTQTDLLFSRAPEYHYEAEDEPVYAQYLDENNEPRESPNNFYANKTIKPSIVKRNQGKPLQEIYNNNNNNDENHQDTAYNYADLKQDYDAEVEKEKKSEQVLKYVDVTEKEGIKDSAKNLLSLKTPKNCTKEEMSGIGLNAARCFMKDLGSISKKSKKEQKDIFKRVLKVILIWVGVYLIIAIPLWCTKGWCCCCFRCKFCRPRQTIEATKMFLAQNPIGVLHIDGKKVNYKPTVYEQYAQRRLEKVVMKL